ncbi:MAG: hypothetical protein ABJB40_06295 [Acidobacteriota bacterium]
MDIRRDFERFNGGPTVASRDRMHVTIGPKGLLYLNANTHRMLGNPSAVYLNYSRTREAIAIEPASPRMPLAFPVLVKREGFGIHAAPFFRHFGIAFDKTERFVSPDIVQGILILKLAETCVATRPPRKKNKKREVR